MSWKLASTILQKQIPEGKLLAVVLALHCGQSLSCWPSVARLARECETSKRDIYRTLAKLKQLGYVTSKRRGPQAVLFTLHPDRMPDSTGDAAVTSRDDAAVTSGNATGDTADTLQVTRVSIRPDIHVTSNKEERILRGKKQRKSSASTHPTLAEITAYCQERGNNVDPEKFFDHYQSNGWKVGRNPMKDWRAAVRTWEKNNYGNNQKQKLSQQEILERELRIGKAKTFHA